MSGLVIAESMEDVTREARGHWLVELFDERGRMVDRATADNFISNAMKDHAKWMARYPYRASFVGVDTDPQPVYPWYRIMLTDSSKAESSGTETLVPGKTVAWANRTTYAGNAPLRGTANTAESLITPTTCKWVFDWPSSGGIGTFQSLCWAFDGVTRSGMTPILRTEGGPDAFAWWGEAQLPAYGYGSTLINGFATTPASIIHEESTGTIWRITRGALQAQKWTTVLTQPYVAVYDDGLSLATANPSLTGAFANDFTVANNVNDLGYPGSGGALWGTQFASPYALQRFNFPAGGAVQQTITKPWSDAEPGLVAFDGTNLYCCRNGSGMTAPSSINGLDPSGPVTVYKVRASDGVTLGSWTHPRRIFALNWDPTNNRLLVFDCYGYGRSNASTISTQVGTVARAVAYDATGNLDWQATVIYPYAWNTATTFQLTDASILGYGGDIVVAASWTNYGGSTGQALMRYKPTNLGARALLGSPLTKSSLQTMKVTYTITYS
jgi:hypothetical protein